MVQSRLLIRENRHADLAMWPNAGTEGRKIIGESVYLAKKKKKRKKTLGREKFYSKRKFFDGCGSIFDSIFYFKGKNRELQGTDD